MAGLWYRVGTVSVTTDSKKVVGTGTQFKTSATKPDKGHTFWGPDGLHYEVDYVESDTVLYLVKPYTGATAAGQSYEIDITRTSTIPALSRDVSAMLAYAQGQYDAWQEILTGAGDVTLTAPDGQAVTVPALANMLSKSGNLAGLTDKAAARENLGAQAVGTAAFDGSTANANWNEWGGFNEHTPSYNFSVRQYDDANGAGDNAPPTGGFGVAICIGASLFSTQVVFPHSSATGVKYRGVFHPSGAYSQWITIRDTSNTVIDANGYIKAASPVMRLHDSAVDELEHIDSGEWSSAGCALVNAEAHRASAERISDGHYRVTGCHGFARSGWYIETPTDANGNKLLHVRYVQNEDGSIDIFTSTPDYSTGMCTAGAPAVIPVGRWIDLRLCMAAEPPAVTYSDLAEAEPVAE